MVTHSQTRKLAASQTRTFPLAFLTRSWLLAKIRPSMLENHDTGQLSAPAGRPDLYFVWPLLALIVLSLATMLRFDRPLIRGDGIAYLAWVDTFVLDGDVNFDNQLERLQAVNTYQITWNEETRRFVNVFPFGVALLQIPFYAIGHLFQLNGWYNLNPDYFHQMQGLGLPYSLWLMVGANVMALLAIILAWLVGRRLADNWTAAIAAWAVFLGSPLFYYSTVSPLNSHNPGALATAAFIYLLVDVGGAFREGERPPAPLYKWALLGLSAGVMVLVRWQLLLVVLPGLALVAGQRRWRGLLTAAIVTAVTALPLPLIWQRMFNRFIVVPYQAVEGEAFLSLPVGSWWVLVETPRNSPVLYLSLIGLFFLWRIDRRWTIFAAAVILLQVLMNGAVLDWWGGETYGIRRMTELYPLYVLLACAALGDLRLQQGARKVWAIAARGALVLIILYSFLYILSFFSFTWTNPDHAFIAGPETMIPYFLNQENRWEVIASIFRTHLGPPAWPMPGP